MTNYVNFNSPTSIGMVGTVFYGNGYGASIQRNDQPDLEDPTKKYSIGFLKQYDYHTWSCEIDEKLSSISQEPELYNLTEEQIDALLDQIKVL